MTTITEQFPITNDTNIEEKLVIFNARVNTNPEIYSAKLVSAPTYDSNVVSAEFDAPLTYKELITLKIIVSVIFDEVSVNTIYTQPRIVYSQRTDLPLDTAFFNLLDNMNGFIDGSILVVPQNQKVYTCFSNTTGAASWLMLGN